MGDVHDVRLAMEGTFETTAGAPSEPMAVQAAAQSKLPWIAAAALVAAITGGAVWGLMTRAPNEAPTVSRFTIEMPPEDPVVTTYGWRVVTISPDGSRIAYASAPGGSSTRQIYVRPLDELEASVLRGTEGDGSAPFFSPDGESIGLTGESNGRTLKRVSALGGPPVTIASFDSQPHGMAWTRDDTILFSLNSSRGLLRIPAVGGEVEQLTTPAEASGERHHRATLLPDGDTVLFTISGRTGEEPQLARLSLSSREVTRLPLNGSDPVYSPTGHIVYVVLDNTLRAVGFDLDRLELTSTNPVPVLENVNSGALGDTGPGPTVPVSIGGGNHVTWSQSGSELFYRQETRMMAVEVSAEGAVSTPTELFDGDFVAASPGGTRLYHVAPDDRFLMLREGDASTGTEVPPQVVLVENWFQELTERVPVN